MADENNVQTPEILHLVSDARAGIETLAQQVKALKAHTGFEDASDKGECLANVTIAFRALEDAKMRLGKVVQHYHGGRSIYDESPKS